MAQAEPTNTNQDLDARRLERLRNDPNVIVHRGSGKPFVSDLRVKEGTDILWLIGRTDDDEEDEATEQDDCC